ncbi:MAG: hypothetical protein ACYSRZ_05805 [Planctomycetota bacterium]|jgi:hypothetical protein
MFNIFEQPWTLLVASAVLLLILKLLSLPKKLWYLWLTPLLLAGIALPLDHFIKTDREKINHLVNSVLDAFEQENAAAISVLISADYKDSYHNSKTALVSYCKSLLSGPLIEKNQKTSAVINITAPDATAVLMVWTTFDKAGFVYQYKAYQLTEVKLYLQKQSLPESKSPISDCWLICRAEILEIDHRPADWRNIK